MRIPALSCVLLALSCSAFAADGETTQVYFSNGHLEYVGAINSDANQRLFDLYDKLPNKPTTLSIRSIGGSVNPGMELGAWVHAKKLNIKVMEFCFSSCANYVFTGAIKKTVSNFAMIGYHGGPGDPEKLAFDANTQAMFDALPAAGKKALMDSIKNDAVLLGRREAAYFQNIGVRTDISSLGQGDQFKPLLDKHPEAQGWTYSLADFALLGVRDITVINPPWKPGVASKETIVVTIPVDLKHASAP
jgi:hypothetical protein